MYTPKKFKQEDHSYLIESIRTIQFGALVIFADNRFFSSHLPFVVKVDNDCLVLEGHIAKANELWQVAQPQNKAMVIFQGPNTYIHPGWYPTKKETAKVVPTWNYLVIHCYGNAVAQQTEEWLLNNVTELTNHNEKDQTQPWQITDAPADHIKALLKAIIGIKVQVDHIESSLKMSQNQVTRNRHGVIAGLTESGIPSACEVAQMMQRLE